MLTQKIRGEYYIIGLKFNLVPYRNKIRKNNKSTIYVSRNKQQSFIVDFMKAFKTMGASLLLNQCRFKNYCFKFEISCTSYLGGVAFSILNVSIKFNVT